MEWSGAERSCAALRCAALRCVALFNGLQINYNKQSGFEVKANFLYL